MQRKGYLCIFAKPPRPGAVKTRLAPEVGSEGAAALARAFSRDTWSAVCLLPWARPVLATTDAEARDWDFTRRAEIWLQGDGDLGERLERVLQRALRLAPFAIGIGIDTPGLPHPLLEQARESLRDSDAVLGPCEDGGFYLMGLRRCPPGLLRNLSWSARDTFIQTLARLRNWGFQTKVLPPWFDVDRPSDLRRLQFLLSRGVISAPQTARILSETLPPIRQRRRGSSRASR
jgi:rSAM/selenodomain-associated transferase 1